MPYKTNAPNAAQSPALFPAEGVDNFTRLKAIITANHKFNDSAAVDDGYHQNIQMIPIAVPANNGTIGQAFCNSADATGQLWHKDRLNRVFQITPSIPIYAAANFSSQGGTLVVRWSFGLSTIVRQGAGDFSLVFSTPMANANYVVAGTTQTLTGQGFLQAKAGSYSSNVGTTLVNIQTTAISGLMVDVQAAFVVIMGG